MLSSWRESVIGAHAFGDCAAFSLTPARRCLCRLLSRRMLHLMSLPRQPGRQVMLFATMSMPDFKADAEEFSLLKAADGLPPPFYNDAPRLAYATFSATSSIRFCPMPGELAADEARFSCRCLRPGHDASRSRPGRFIVGIFP